MFREDPNQPDSQRTPKVKRPEDLRQPNSLLTTVDGRPDNLRDFYAGGSAFLVCAGPSLATMDLCPLTARGVLTMAVNNAAVAAPVLKSGLRVNLWTCIDNPASFAEQIWLDPGILKFTALAHHDAKLELGTAGGGTNTSGRRINECPSVLYFCYDSDWWPQTFLYGSRISWGNSDHSTDPLGYRGGRSVMLAALRLLFYLGVRTVYLLGCDFEMKAEGEGNYAFDQYRSKGSVRHNNELFCIVNERLKALLPYFGHEKFRVFNCTPGGGLDAFPRKEYQSALLEVRDAFPQHVVTANRYERPKSK